MKHLGAIAGRELRSYFVSPVAYVVLVLFALIGGFLFLLSVLSFDTNVNGSTSASCLDPRIAELRSVTLHGCVGGHAGPPLRL